jgi:hypothetical protein
MRYSNESQLWFALWLVNLNYASQQFQTLVWRPAVDWWWRLLVVATCWDLSRQWALTAKQGWKNEMVDALIQNICSNAILDVKSYSAQRAAHCCMGGKRWLTDKHVWVASQFRPRVEVWCYSMRRISPFVISHIIHYDSYTYDSRYI